MDEETFAFGSLRLIPAQRMLLDGERSLRLGSRALDILIALVESAGETIHKDRLIARIWPDTVVDEGALRVHVAALRKALGDGRAGRRCIANNPGRGYTFVAPVTREHQRAAPVSRMAGLQPTICPCLSLASSAGGYRTERALESLEPYMNLSAPLEMQLQLALGLTLTLTMGSVENARMALAIALEIAESLDNVDAQLRTNESCASTSANVVRHDPLRNSSPTLHVAPATRPSRLLLTDSWATRCNTEANSARPSITLNVC
jgi:DNA-binding winged helix-turn-helix (wHTH) protein